MKLSFSEIKRLLPIAKRRVAATIVQWVQRMLSDEKIIRNVYKTDSPRRVLLCHLPEAFANKVQPKHHSNLTECCVIARCFHRLGYCVDCTSRAKTGIDYSGYDIVMGINGNAFFNSISPDASVRPLRIFYSVGAETCFNYRMTALRNRDFYNRHGRWLLASNRYMPGDARNYYEANFADAVICLGDEYVLGKFIEEDSRIDKFKLLPAFYFPVAKPDEKKDFSLCRRNILWFGSSGMLHKGLDIAIDFALSHPQFTLHVCGGSRQESDFWHYYQPKIKGVSNIVMHGFVDIESKRFASILEMCGILLNPSISEGCAVSVLNVLGNGALLPICSCATGVDFGDAGIRVEEVSYEAFEQALILADAMSVEKFAQKAWDAHRYVHDNCSLEQFEERMFGFIQDIIGENKNKE